ncbi:sugar phosphate isomerase/epimerase family protein [Vallitalea okinawensis]|uniref:sugar phosphate isomerase/epimerase family protein n=1 Tax=Vallitalea okinawensis TaxID=2078660 RepID=UPI000CFDDD48|nr:sugar phosphate isomerase/epimerase family protein [Vallitalea okinawensis]
MAKFTLSAFADEIDENLKVQMNVLEKNNITYIEMRGVNGKNVSDLTIEEAKNIKKDMDERGFKLSSIGSPIGKISIVDDFEPHLEKFKHTLELSVILDAPYIRMFSFLIPEGDTPEEHRDEVMRRWNAFLDAAKKYDVTLLHENEKRIYGDTAERCLDLVETLKNDQMKLIFDPANFIQCGVETYPHAFNLLKEHIVYFHIKDALDDSGKVVPSGYGKGHIETILTIMKEANYEGFLSLEPHLGNFTGFAELEDVDIDETLENSGPAKFEVAANALKAILNRL